MPDNRQPVAIPAGMMRVWDPEQKKVIFVAAPPAGPARITLTFRLHDAAETQDNSKSASWVTVQVDRADLTIPKAEFIAKYIEPNISGLKQLELT